jgi:hypothetical protein
MPLGRVGWHSANGDKLVQELQSDAIKASLIKAKFARSDPEFLELFVTNFTRMASRMRWS